MKIVKTILVLFSLMFGMACAAVYYPANDQNTAGKVAELIGALSPVAGTSLALPKADATGWELKQCSSKSDIKAALQLDSLLDTFTTEVDGVKKGSCCINAHHEACIAIQDQIRSCGHLGKGTEATSTNSSICPQ